MRLLRRKKKSEMPKARTRRSAGGLSRVVNAMLAIHVHDPKTLLTDMPSGDRLKSIAGDALSRHDPTLTLSSSAYVRAIVTGGGLSMAKQEVQARSDAPGMMKDMLRERRLGSSSQEVELWTEELNPSVRVVWVASIRS